MSDTVSTTSEVRTGLYIGGEERHTDATLDIPDPAKPGVIVGRAAAASPQDVDDAIAAAKGAFGSWSALSATDRAAQMAQAIAGIA
ncbi:MAG: aldehyde dehydrogenase family protein, partial [Microbacterium sp.]